MKKKLLSVVLSAAMVATLLAGCGGSSTGDAGAAAPAATDSSSDASSTDDSAAATDDTAAASGDVEEITWMFWDDLEASSDQITIGFKETVDRFNKDYEGQYHCNVVTTNLEEYYAKLNALVAAGDTPDCFIVSPGPNLSVYVDPGVIAPLDDYLADGWIDTFNGGKNAFSQQTYDGKIYAVPINIAAACVFYNTEMFANAGIDTMPTDWDGFMDACQKLKDAGYDPITISAGTAWCLSMLAGYLCDSEGVDLKAIEAGTAHWTDQNVKNACQKLIDVSKYFQSTAAGDDNDVATSHLYKEEAAILIQGSWAIGQMNGANPDFANKCGVFAFPGTGGRVIAKSDSLAMSSTTEHPEAVIALMKYFTDDTAQKYTAEVGGKIPVTTVQYDAAAAPPQLAYVMDVFGNASSTFGFYNESLASTEAGSFFDDQMVSIFTGQSTIDEATQALEDFYAENIW